MPLYEYSCRKCHNDFELLIRADERPVCPACGSQRLEKQLSVTAAHSGSTQLGAPPGGCGQPQCGMGGCAME